MKSWPRNKILAVVAGSLIFIGVAPRVNLYFWHRAHNLFPLQMPLPVKTGEYTSPFFTTDLDEAYEIEAYTSDYPAQKVQMDLDWKVEDEVGGVIQKGTYSGPIDSGYELIAQYRPKLGTSQRIVIEIRKAVQETGAAHPQLSVGLPYVNSDYYDGRDFLNLLALIVAGTGALLLLFLQIPHLRRVRDRHAPARP
jgi:hypothetical protein